MNQEHVAHFQQDLTRACQTEASGVGNLCRGAMPQESRLKTYSIVGLDKREFGNLHPQSTVHQYPRQEPSLKRAGT
eukprot:6466335-Amphidinium_carterae.1